MSIILIDTFHHLSSSHPYTEPLKHYSAQVSQPVSILFVIIQANSAKLAEAPDLSNVPSEYHEFADIFSKTKAEILPSYHPYDLKINLEEGVQPPVGPIYSLSASEQESLTRNPLRKISTQVLSDQPYLHTVHWSYSLRRKMVHCTSVLTSVVLTASLRRIIIHS